MSAFTKQNATHLAGTCQKIQSILDENVDGKLMHSQMVMLGRLLKQFVENPIVKTSGVL
jgi:hypothetical protein